MAEPRQLPFKDGPFDVGSMRNNEGVTKEVEKGGGRVRKMWPTCHLAIRDPMNGGREAVDWDTWAYKAVEGPAGQSTVHDLDGTDLNNMVIRGGCLEIECYQP